MQRTQLAALLLVLLAVGTVVSLKAGKRMAAGARPTPPGITETRLPRLVDLGSTTCIPCKQMAPILEELKRELRGKVNVEFIDVTKHPAASDKYAITVIPTQIFLDARGKELFRHEGFYPKADILAKLRELMLLPEG